jgi:phosphoglycolate phosphatase
MKLPRALILFDVDGTLLRTGGATTRCIWRAAEKAFGRPLGRCQFMPGLLDHELLRCVADHNTIDRPEQFLETYTATYLAELEAELGQTHAEVKPMPGIISLLERLEEMPQIATGILTGNFRQATFLKLRFASLNRFTFTASAFAEDGLVRNDLVAVALQRFAGCFGQPIDMSQTIIVGDTPRDIATAQATGCRVLSVATGAYSLDQLRAFKPDAAVQDLRDTAVLDAVLGLTLGSK